MARQISQHGEHHRTHRIGWLRAAVLGANDGVVSTASLVMGIAAGGRSRQEILLAGVASLVAGAMSMAAGEYVSVQSQADNRQVVPRRADEPPSPAPPGRDAHLSPAGRRRAAFSSAVPAPALISLESKDRVGELRRQRCQ